VGLHLQHARPAHGWQVTQVVWVGQ
jgi:hypothetical protein